LRVSGEEEAREHDREGAEGAKAKTKAKAKAKKANAKAKAKKAPPICIQSITCLNKHTNKHLLTINNNQ